ncbi:DUF5689 domain-containing protein [Desertivirga xinjiangensis]|uniref:DUF5689 domain-containing protein n=1 Tax=Desertivirga xinjiangensis TaxID=539206 RepID=UPI00210C993C|nr:DUF5689 domain-containing protein [Pedobacter xinjiangensis]
MKKILFKCFLLVAAAVVWSGCDDENSYDGGVPSPYIFVFDVLKIHKGTDVVLTTKNMGGANSIQGVVVSDHTSGNMLDGYLMVQNARKISSADSIRGIAIAAGAAAANFKVGDLVRVKVEGKTLTRRNGMLQVIEVSESDIVKVSSGNVIQTNKATTAEILADPKLYESSQVTVSKATFNPVLGPNETYSGDKVLNDGPGNLVLRTDAEATFANDKPNEFGNYTGVVVLTEDASGKLIPHLRMRSGADVLILSPPEPPAFVISGICPDPIGTDADYEYIQFKALRDINFSTENYSVVTTNNAGSNGTPLHGWATAGARTYKFDLTSGTVAKGEYFYVGGTKKQINGAGSSDISSSKWIRSYDYTKDASDLLNGANLAGGNKTNNLLANSGNASGVAVFTGTVVDKNTVPVDVIFIGTGGQIYSAGPPVEGYRITTTDIYDRLDPATGAPQEYYRAGTNTIGFPYVEPANLGNFQAFGGVYDTTIGRGKWTKFRSQKTILMTATSTVAEIENVPGVTTEVK